MDNRQKGKASLRKDDLHLFLRSDCDVRLKKQWIWMYPNQLIPTHGEKPSRECSSYRIECRGIFEHKKQKNGGHSDASR